MVMPPEDKQHWREKYLAALDTQQQQERRYEAQLELMRRALLRVSLAAEGQDEQLDTLLTQVREALRKDKFSDIQPLLGRLETLALQLEQQREQQQLQLRESLVGVLRPWQSLSLPHQVERDLGELQIKVTHLGNQLRQYPGLLQQLQKWQQQALAHLLARDADKEAPSAAIADQTALHLGRLRQLLLAFVDGLAQDSRLYNQCQRLRLQLQSSPDLEGALLVLEQLRQLILDTYQNSARTFTNYLDRVNRELVEISGLLGVALESSSAGQVVSRQLHEQMLQDVSDLALQAEEATELVQLKARVQSQLGSIRQALDKMQQASLSQQLIEQLNQLDRKVKVMEQEAEYSRVSLEQQRRRALQDSLTELPNREAYNQRARVEVERWQHDDNLLSLAIFDIDHFKRINDTFGHQAGDRVLQVIGRSIAKRLRELDFFCRYGGEEFVALLPDTSADQAQLLLEKIRASVAAVELQYKDRPLKLTLSIGLTQFRHGDTLEQAFERADMALYDAKAEGRNLVRLA